MPVESWMKPEDTEALAADAAALIEAALGRLAPCERAAFWSSVRKCYNTPYNDPAPRTLVAAPVALALPEVDVAMAAIPIAAFAETHAP